MKRFARRLAVLAGVCALVLALAEAALWMVKPWPLDPPLYPGDRVASTTTDGPGAIDAAMGWKCAPNVTFEETRPDFRVTYHCNADGFRAMLPREHAPDARGLVFVGDSFTFGVGVEAEQTFVELVAAARADLRVVNLGVSGFGVDQMLCALRAYGLREKPSAVVALFVDDDLTRCLTSYRDRNGWRAKPTFVLDDGALVPRTAENSPSAPLRWIEQHAYLAEFVRRASNRLGATRGIGERFELSRALFAAMNDECRSIGARLVVVHLPQRGSWRPLPAFERAFRELDVPYLDFGSRSVSDPPALFFAKDPHINAGGHRYVADEIARFLTERGL